ncbi:MAG: hypothetical protein IJ752_07665 [Alphaproteobacteria bacterium]|nr:hypothetical protein [Alphaproteobacteria bacterium]
MKKSGMILAAVCMMAMSHGARAAVMPSKTFDASSSIVVAKVLTKAAGEAKSSAKTSSTKGVKIHSTGDSGKSLKKDEKSNNDR